MSNKPEILLLTHRLPFPPNKGDKLRSYHILSHLSADFRIHLGSFVDDEADWEHVGQLTPMCESTCFISNFGWRARAKMANAFITSRPISLSHFSSAKLQRWVDGLASARRLTAAVAVSSPMASFLIDAPHRVPNRVVDFVDMDSEKWRQYGAESTGIMGWVYRREAKLLRRFERRVASTLDWSLFVSESEARVFLTHLPELSDKVLAIENGVDQVFFSPQSGLANPYPDDLRVFVFTGAMDYAPNVQAVCWFAAEVLPRVRAERSNVAFYIVGLNPVDAVRALDAQPGVYVTGRVPDVRPYVQHAVAAVAPMKVARGVQNKVLEALSMGRRVLASSAAAEGIRPEAQLGVIRANSADEYVRAAIEVLDDVAASQPSTVVRESVRRSYDWTRNLGRLNELLHRSGTTAAPSLIG